MNWIIAIAMVALIVNIIMIFQYVLSERREKHLKYHGILHIGEVNGVQNYTLEIIVPLENLETLNYIRLKVDNRL